MPQIHQILNNSYILFCLFLGFWASAQAARRLPLGGEFWGAMAVNSGLAAVIMVLALVMSATGIRPKRGVYFLYALYFVIVLPGTFALLRGRDDRMAAIIYGIVTFFSAGAASRVPLLTQPWLMPE